MKRIFENSFDDMECNESNSSDSLADIGGSTFPSFSQVQEARRIPPAKRIAIIGGGVGGTTAALVLLSEARKLNIDLNVVLFEKSASLVNGPPFCHLHAGGGLYRQISTEQCVVLLKQCVYVFRAFKECFDIRPTLLVTPVSDDGPSPLQMKSRYDKLRNVYRTMVTEDPENAVFGHPEEYIVEIDRKKAEYLKSLDKTQCVELYGNNSWQKWTHSAISKMEDLDDFKFPMFLIQEYGWNMFRQSATMHLALEEFPNCQVLCGCQVSDIHFTSGSTWSIDWKSPSGLCTTECFDFVVNSCGYKTGAIDDKIFHSLYGEKHTKHVERKAELKAAYFAKVDNPDDFLLPEVIIHGQRGTPKGMAQLTPYPGGFYQIHAMTMKGTLFKDGGLVSSNHDGKDTNQQLSSQPVFCTKFEKMIQHEWDALLTEERARHSIDHVVQFLPGMKKLSPATHRGTVVQPLNGAQQIPGSDPELRAIDGITKVTDSYFRVEIVKASSALTCAQDLVRILLDISVDIPLSTEFEEVEKLDLETIYGVAGVVCENQGYPKHLCLKYGDIIVE